MTDNKDETISVNSDSTPADDIMDNTQVNTEKKPDTNNNEFTDDYPCTDYDREKTSDRQGRKKLKATIIVLVCIVSAVLLFLLIRSFGKNRR